MYEVAHTWNVVVSALNFLPVYDNENFSCASILKKSIDQACIAL